jgi:hypothetical protein
MPSTRSALTLAAGGLLIAALPLAASATAAPDSPPTFTTDARGFVDSAARCPEGQSAVAIGRTQRSLVVVCTTPGDGPYEYRGVRISDGASMKAAVTATTDSFIAEPGTTTYTVTPETLSVTSGGKLIYRDTWIEYQNPRFNAENGSTATSTPAARPAG